jgi:hypothetical protein
MINLFQPVSYYFNEGDLPLQQTLDLRAEDNGTAISPTFIEAKTGEQAILSGSISITDGNFERCNAAFRDGKGQAMGGDVPLVNGRLFEFRQLWVNGRKATRAKSSNGETMQRFSPGIKVMKAVGYPHRHFQIWSSRKCRNVHSSMVGDCCTSHKKMEKHGDSTKLFFHQPESKIQNDHPGPRHGSQKKQVILRFINQCITVSRRTR